MNPIRFSLFLFLAAAFSSQMAASFAAEEAQATAYWVAPMKRVHARFTGTQGTFAEFGDSITITMAFWSPLAGEPKTMTADDARTHMLVKRYQKPECWSQWKGPEFGNNGSMTIRWAHTNVDKWLEKLNPEAVVIMFGSNDVGQMEVDEYEQKTRDVTQRCLRNGAIVLLTTAPPRSGQWEKSRQFANAVRKIAREERVPLIDFFGEIMKRRPDDWDGALPQFAGSPGDDYQVPTLIARDGVHPSNPKPYANVFSHEGLRNNGYTLRNYLTLTAYAEVIDKVLQPPPATTVVPAGKPPAVLFSESFDDPQLLQRGWYDGSKFNIADTQPYAGKGCVEYAWKAGTTTPFNSSGIRHLFEASETVYLRFYIRLSKGWGWTGRSYHPHLMHFMTTENDRFHGPAASHLTVYIEPWNGRLRLAATDIQNKDQPHGLTQGPLRGGYNAQLYDSKETLFNDDGWHCVEAMFQLNSLDLKADKPNANGIVRGWLDDKLVIDRTDVVLRSTDFPTMKFNQFLLTPYFGPGLLPHEQTLWIDELAVGTKRLGPATNRSAGF